MTTSHNIPAGWQRLEFGAFAQRSKARFNPVGAAESRMCVELEHIEPQTGQLIGFIDSASQASIKSAFEPDQVLFGKLRPYLQKYWLADKPGVCTSEIWVLMANPEICTPEYLFYLVQSPEFIRACGVTSGSKMPRADWELVAQYPLLVPSLEQQPYITGALRTWDDAIALQSRQLRELRRRKDGIAQELLSQRKRLPGFNGALNLASAGSIFSPVSTRGQEQEELLSVTQEQGVVPRTMLEGRVVMPEGTTAGYKLVEPGNFVISLRSFQGGIEYSEYRGLVSPAYTVLQSTNRAIPEYYKHYFKSTDFISRLASAVIGIRDGKQISFKDFAIINIPNPEPKEQRAIAEVLDTAAVEIHLLERKLQAVRDQKRGLLQQLLTGQVLLS